MKGSMYELISDDCIITAYEHESHWTITIENHEKYNGVKTFSDFESVETYVKTVLKTTKNKELVWDNLTPPVKLYTL